jgi:hypothetical protein
MANTPGADYLYWLQSHYWDFWSGLSQGHQQKITQLAVNAPSRADFFSQVQGMDAWGWYQSKQGTTPGPTPPPPPAPAPPPATDQPGAIDATFNTGPAQTLQFDPSADIRTTIQGYMEQWGLGDLGGFLQQAISEKWSPDQIIIQLRQTPQYLAVFPENGLRKGNGFSFMPESQILAYRNEAKRLAGQYLGINVSNSEIANLIGHDNSLSELESKLATEAKVQQYGQTVNGLFMQELGYSLDPARLHDFFSNDVTTPELDRAYQTALDRGRTEGIGLGVRPMSEADQLYKMGLSPDQVFRNYQGVASELPAAQRWAMIENHINNSSSFPNTSDAMGNTPYGTLYRAIQLQDPAALAELQQQMAAEVARFQAGGAPTQSSSGALSGLLSEEQRAGV